MAYSRSYSTQKSPFEFVYGTYTHKDEKNIQKAGNPDFKIEIEMSCFYEIPYINADAYNGTDETDHSIADIDPALS